MPIRNGPARRALWTAITFSALWACGGDTIGGGPDAGPSSSSGGSSGSSSGSGSREVPINHRPNDDLCTQPAPPGDCVGSSSGAPNARCSTDADCADAGPGGRCIESTTGGPADVCYCTYDMCTGDAACPSGQTCACHGSAYLSGGSTCTPGNCRVDADCGAGGYCSPTESTAGCGGLAGYYCHTPKDLCVNDSDCSNTDACMYEASAGYWECEALQECFTAM
jgi:hypothetical protein